MKTNETFAVKVFQKGILKKRRELIHTESGEIAFKDALQDVFREIAIMKKLKHPNLISLHEVIDDEEDDRLFMVIDIADNGPIMD